MENKRLLIILGTAGFILLIPAVAMHFSYEVYWTPSDFKIMGLLLLGTALLCELVLRAVKSLKARIIICGLIVLALVLICAELAVGIFSSPFAGS